MTNRNNHHDHCNHNSPFFTIITILLTSTFTQSTTTGEQTPSPSSPANHCADSVISFSPCPPYISAPPNNLSNEPSSQCCDNFNGAFDSDDADCLCYLVRQNSLLGFSLNVTKMMLLSDLCLDKNSIQANGMDTSLDLICSDSPTPPPLNAMPKKPPTGYKLTSYNPLNAASTRRRNTTKPSYSEQSNDLELTNAMSMRLQSFIRYGWEI
ncbi:hypothetical protein QVD17_20646 [Tagetes erecta]|uniref:Bifunctional inhibitor/plant lipid transfer protein/seed storage helical domain-containing protein n=1 Tax=Tagetes erecta TaxID=13708 RepID=A0AAD8NR73_TARER|nr:hypothetical protein QVD17_20646 [Tagetes erecta]